MQTSLTLVDGGSSWNFNHRFTDAQGGNTWTYQSPSGDIDGIRTLTRASTRTKAGIVSRAVKLTVPYLNGATGKYDKSIQVRVVTNAPAAGITLADVKSALVMLMSVYDDTVNTGFIDDYVNGY